jgi:hypothetical protein
VRAADSGSDGCSWRSVRPVEVCRSVDSADVSRSAGEPFVEARASSRKEGSMGILWIILIVVLVLALLGFFGFRR